MASRDPTLVFQKNKNKLIIVLPQVFLSFDGGSNNVNWNHVRAKQAFVFLRSFSFLKRLVRRNKGLSKEEVFLI